MKHSESIAAIGKALAAAQTEYTPVPKNKIAKIRGKNNTEYTYRYADLADVLNMALPVLSSHGIAFLQPNERVADKLFVTTLLIHESGEWMQSDGIEVDEMEMKWNEYEKKSVLERCDPRTIGGDFTYYRRYDGCSFIGIAPDEDVDAANNGPLPNSRGKNTTDAKESRATSHPESRPTSTQQSVKQATERAQTAPAAAQPQAGQLKFIPPNGLITVIKGVQDVAAKPAQDGKKATRPYVIVTFLGTHNGCNFAYCFDDKFWPLLHESVGLECHFQIKERDKDGTHFINIEDVLFVDGDEYQDGKPVVKGEAQ